jgi:MFS superfamily sulfate permease-like transporter
MLEVASLKGLYKIDRVEFGIALGVTLAILIAGVVPGIILGLLLSLISVLVEISRPGDAVLRGSSATASSTIAVEGEDAESVPGLLVYRLYAPLNFANARHVMNAHPDAGRRGRSAGQVAGHRRPGDPRHGRHRRAALCGTASRTGRGGR